MHVAIINIKGLVGIRNDQKLFLRGAEMKSLTTINNAFLICKDGLIDSYGKMDNFSSNDNYDKTIDAKGRFVLPTWCDSHTHLVYATNREGEFVDRINGLTYQDIANKGGGILNSAKKLALKSEDDLYESANARLNLVKSLGTGAIEIKTGYGLSFEAELKMLRVINKLKNESNIAIKSTLLAAHAIPEKYKNNRADYIYVIINEILPEVSKQNLADYIDVFCETNYFTVPEMIEILEAGTHYGLKPKVHVNQFTSIGGIDAAVKHHALSVDHLEEMKEKDYRALTNSNTSATLLPSCSFFLGIPFAPARDLINKNAIVTLASDYNPGSTPSGNMNFVISLACIKQKMFPEEAINAATLNGAYAMDLSHEYGSIEIGKKASIIITKPISSLAYLPYSFGENNIEETLIL